MAKFRCAQHRALLLLGSATPDVVSRYYAETGRYHYFTLPDRFNARKLPDVIIADMKQELRNGNSGSISSVLYGELEENLRRGEQSILFLNRRGASKIVTCAECGATYSCPNCSVSLTYHQGNQMLICHHCGYRRRVDPQCPVCGGETQIRQMNDVKSLYCTNPDCQAKKIKSFSLLVSRDALNIDGLSEATLEKFIARGFIHDFGDIFEIGKHRDEIVEMDGFGEESFENLMTSLDKAKETTLAKVIYSLGIANIGLANAKVICRHFDDDLEKIRHADKEEISSIDTIGPVIAGSLTDYFSNEDNNRKLDHLMSHLTVKKE